MVLRMKWLMAMLSLAALDESSKYFLNVMHEEQCHEYDTED